MLRSLSKNVLLLSISFIFNSASAAPPAPAKQTVPAAQACTITYLKKQYKEAFNFCTQAAPTNANSQMLLGTLYHDGLGVKQDYAQAFNWLSKAAQQGHGAAMYTLSILYKTGQGVKKNEKTALSWLQKAAAKNVVSAQYDLGDAYRLGQGTGKNLKEAFKWYEKASQAGNTNAAYNLGLMYLKGDGIATNVVKGYAWIAMAARNDNASAQGALKKIQETLTYNQFIEAKVLSLMTEASIVSPNLFKQYSQQLLRK